MDRRVADVMWEMLAKAGVKRCYGIVGDALNPVIDALRGRKLHPQSHQTSIDREDGFGDQDDRTQHTIDLICG